MVRNDRVQKLCPDLGCSYNSQEVLRNSEVRFCYRKISIGLRQVSRQGVVETKLSPLVNHHLVYVNFLVCHCRNVGRLRLPLTSFFVQQYEKAFRFRMLHLTL